MQGMILIDLKGYDLRKTPKFIGISWSRKEKNVDYVKTTANLKPIS